jgi:hypothetical protein
VESVIGRLAAAAALVAAVAVFVILAGPSSCSTNGPALDPWRNHMAQAPTIISGLVQDDHGRPVALARVYLISAPVALADVAMLTSADGTFRLAAPAHGRYQIGVSADGYATASATATVKGGQEVAVRVQLTPAKN